MSVLVAGFMVGGWRHVTAAIRLMSRSINSFHYTRFSRGLVLSFLLVKPPNTCQFTTSSVSLIKKRMPPKKAPVAEKKVLLGRPGNNLKIGIVGLPNVGKSSFFNALSKTGQYSYSLSSRSPGCCSCCFFSKKKKIWARLQISPMRLLTPKVCQLVTPGDDRAPHDVYVPVGHL